MSHTLRFLFCYVISILMTSSAKGNSLLASYFKPEFLNYHMNLSNFTNSHELIKTSTNTESFMSKSLYSTKSSFDTTTDHSNLELKINNLPDFSVEKGDDRNLKKVILENSNEIPYGELNPLVQNLKESGLSVKGEDGGQSEVYWKDFNSTYARILSITTSKSTGNSENKFDEDVEMVKNMGELVASNETLSFNSTEITGENFHHWGHLKSILENMKSIMFEEFTASTDAEKWAFAIIDAAISVGDELNIVNEVISMIDKDLIHFLSQQWQVLEANILNHSPVLKFILKLKSAVPSTEALLNLISNIAPKYSLMELKQFGDIPFVVELMKSAGFANLEISKVFEILGVPAVISNDEDSNEERKYGYYIDRTGIDRTGGYGHSDHGGGYGHTSHHKGGYGKMSNLDPFVLLAGLAFASFLAFLLFRLLSVPVGKKRSVPDLSMTLDLSDIPVVMENLHNHLETTEKLYSSNFQNPLEQNLESETISDITTAINNMWAYVTQGSERTTCLKRFLCDHINANSINNFSLRFTLQQFALSILAALFGGLSTGQLVDQYLQEMQLEGKLQCPDSGELCPSAIVQ